MCFNFFFLHREDERLVAAEHFLEMISKLIEAGCTVGDLRKLAFTPREIRELGHFSFGAMRECLHGELLKAAGFTINDFKANSVPWEEVKKLFPSDELASLASMSRRQCCRHGRRRKRNASMAKRFGLLTALTLKKIAVQ